ncbi:hypothetical protein CDAR_98441 [Caerostris darwini]|uniref:Uncharacterized protein n=1 Tax=Caerostris darwini TaxID=1538125 RepID=A0AAV4UFV8_9ARAC|nr:hypothetical protein CDAR_98441 [Caerostris darwini]
MVGNKLNDNNVCLEELEDVREFLLGLDSSAAPLLKTELDRIQENRHCDLDRGHSHGVHWILRQADHHSHKQHSYCPLKSNFDLSELF